MASQNVSLCTDVPSSLRKKSGEETSSPLPIFPEGGGDVCTQATKRLYTGYKTAVLWFLSLLCLLLHFFPLFHFYFTSRDLQPFGPGSPFSPFIPLFPEEPFSPFKPNRINQIIRLFDINFSRHKDCAYILLLS